MSLPKEEPGYIEFGRGAPAWLESIGSLVTDIYGLSTGSAVFVSPQSHISYPNMLDKHPLWPFLRLEKRTVTIADGFCRAFCEYAGFEGTPVPVIEWSSGVAEEPIETHPDFASFAGTASAPLNGAVWVGDDGLISTDDSTAHFERFVGSEFAGTTSYLNPQIVKKVTTISQFAIMVDAGHLDGTMLKVASSSQQRGIVYVNTEEWRGPGRRGWNSDIYS